MLRIGSNHYELIRAHSGFSVSLLSKTDDVLGREQRWDLEAHYVPSETNHTPRADGEPEYLKVTFTSEEYVVKDWRELSGLGLDTEEDTWLGWVTLENLLVGGFDKESWKIIPGRLEVARVRDYLFHCEFDGFVRHKDGTEEEIEFQDDLPFREAVAYVPINAADPAATARAMASRAVGLKEFAGSRVLPYDPQKETYFSIRVNSHNRVTLPTAWRHHLA